MNKKNVLISLCLILLICFCFETVSFAVTGTVTGKTVRIRTSPSTSADVVTNAYKNDTLEVISKTENWYKVNYEGKEGYISADYVSVKEDIDEEKTTTYKVKEVNINDIYFLKENAQVYILPMFSASIIGNIESVAEVVIIQIANNWVYVKYGTLNGWILKSTLKEQTVAIETSEETVNSSVEESKESTSETVTETTEKTLPKVGYVNVDMANLREGPTTKAEHIITLTLNTEVKIYNEVDGWYEVDAKDKHGYISKKLISENMQ